MTEVVVPQRHPLLEPVHRIIEDHSCAVLSFDIFDTVLWRRVPRPADVFGLLGARLRRTGLAPEWVTDATFRHLRIKAEDRARHGRAALGTEVSLFDIWREMPSTVFPPDRLDEYVRAEIETEREFTVVDLDVAEVVQSAIKHDVEVVFVSDTYFTEDHLNYLLDRQELGSLRNVRIFRSHPHGVDKASGLFGVVLKELGKRPEQIVHVGDNVIADFEVPRRMGIRTVHFRRLDDELAQTLERENDTPRALRPVRTAPGPAARRLRHHEPARQDDRGEHARLVLRGRSRVAVRGVGLRTGADRVRRVGRAEGAPAGQEGPLVPDARGRTAR